MIAEKIADGIVHYAGRQQQIAEIEWTGHPVFTGVSLKHLIRGTDTEHLFSCHLVRIEPHCRLESHCHDMQIELHEVLAGSGQFLQCDEIIPYHPGKMAVIPKGEKHMVQAGEEGLVLLAKFFPALP